MKNNLKNTTKTAIKTAALLLTLSGMGHGGTLDEVKSLWDPQGISGASSASRRDGAPHAVTPASQPRWSRS
ncbi:conjugal transfer protein TrbB [Klebsiella pneumoniae]|nr:conjugal transfer protein TrbB [Klebsiella pneumoniae]